MSQFVHLHNHTEYSLLDGLSKIPKLVKACKDLGMEALAITDHGTLYGAIEFYKACREQGIKPIIGAELYVAKRSHKDKQGKIDTEPYHLTVLAKNYKGYLNLIKLVSISNLDGFYYRPRVDKKLLEEFHEGLIALSGCPASEFMRSIEEKDIKKAEEKAQEYLQIFEEGNYYFEIQNHFYGEFLKKPELHEAIKTDLRHMGSLQETSWDAVKKLSPKLGIPIVATNDLHYIYPEDAQAQDALVCIQTGKLLKDIKRLRMIDTPNLYLKSPQEMKEAFQEVPEALVQTVKIAAKCEIEIPIGKAHFPIFECPEQKNADQYLREQTMDKAKARMELTPFRVERLEYELGIIEKKNYSTYFLVVADFVNWAHERGIITNTRGSAAGSLVSYALGITNIDPLFYNLPFERFLNPFRPSLPDIDVDLADDRRDEVIGYVSKKYGEDKVAHIVTFGTMMGRAAIRDIGRVMGVPYGEVDRIAKLVPPPHQGFHKPLQDAIKEVYELADLYKKDTTVKKLLDLAIRVESTVRHASVHAAGIVISPQILTNFTPLQREAKGDKVVTQYDMFSIEDAGLVKMDFLGIRNLSILGKAVEFVKEARGTHIDLDTLPLDDKKTYEILSKGNTMGVFQLESSGMTKYLVDLKPTSIFDIMAMVALYRPGPLSIIPEYIARKQNPSKINYFDPRMKKDLEKSLGLLVFQDDVLLTAINLAGYSWEEVDKFRKAMGKKIPAEMNKQKDKFIEGCITNGIGREKAEEIFALMEPFAKYGFNKAHAASYAIIAYQTAYMKANFPVEFMAAVMTAESGDADKIAQAIDECKKLGIVVLPPDINYSGVGFTLETLKELSEEDFERKITEAGKAKKLGIRFGLSAIKNVGEGAIEAVLKVKEEKPCASLFDLISRVDTRLVNRKTLESLLKAGACDAFGKRSSQLMVLDQYLEEAHKRNKQKISGQVSLFGEDPEKPPETILPEADEMVMDKLLMFEKELLGFYLHEPLFIGKLNRIEELIEIKINDISDEHLNKKVRLGGVITEAKRVTTKRTGSEMAFIKIFDKSGEIECVVFPKTYSEKKDILNKEEVVLCYGRIDKRDEKYSLIVEEIEVFDGSRTIMLFVEIDLPRGTDAALLMKVNKLLRSYPGESKASIFVPNGEGVKKIDLTYTINPNSELISNMEELIGPGSVRLIKSEGEVALRGKI